MSLQTITDHLLLPSIPISIPIAEDGVRLSGARIVAAAATAAVLLVACEPGQGEPPGDTNTGETRLGEGLDVVTPTFALASLAQRLAPGADVRLLGGSGQDPHGLELSPGERSAIEDADIAAYVGDVSFQPQVERAMAGAGGEVLSVVGVIGDDALREMDDDAAEHDDHEHDDHDDAHDEPGRPDPHVWLDPALMSEVATELGATFARVDPDRGAAYEERAADLADELIATGDDIDARLSDCEHDVALVGHEAWSYLLEPRGLAQEGISAASGHGQASPQRLADLTDLIAERDVPGVFAEPVEGREDAEALAAEADVELYEVDPLGTPVDADAWLERGYLDLLDEQVEAFARGLRCRT